MHFIVCGYHDGSSLDVCLFVQMIVEKIRPYGESRVRERHSGENVVMVLAALRNNVASVNIEMSIGIVDEQAFPSFPLNVVVVEHPFSCRGESGAIFCSVVLQMCFLANQDTQLQQINQQLGPIIFEVWQVVYCSNRTDSVAL